MKHSQTTRINSKQLLSMLGVKCLCCMLCWVFPRLANCLTHCPCSPFEIRFKLFHSFCFLSLISPLSLSLSLSLFCLSVCLSVSLSLSLFLFYPFCCFFSIAVQVYLCPNSLSFSLTLSLPLPYLT